MELVRAGNAAAFEAIFDRHTPGLLSFCRHMLGSLEEAEDAVQHTFFAAHRALLADDRPIRLKAWLYAIARNRCLSILRARKEESELDESLVPSTFGLSSEVERREDLKAMLADLARLPEEQRSALVLSELGAHSHDDIAEVLGVRREKVKALVFQARESLAGARTARETPCRDIREQLATARGGALRRGPLRRHLEICDGCRSFRDDVSRQRAALALLLPVAPSLALRHAVLAGTVGLGGTAAGGGGLLAGAGSKGLLAKLLAGVAIVGTAGGGVVAVHALRHHDVPVPGTAAAAPKTLTRSVVAADAAAVATPTSGATSLPAVGAPPAGHPSARALRHGRGADRAKGVHGRRAAPGLAKPKPGRGHGYGRDHGTGRPAAVIGYHRTTRPGSSHTRTGRQQARTHRRPSRHTAPVVSTTDASGTSSDTAAPATTTTTTTTNTGVAGGLPSVPKLPVPGKAKG